MRVFLLLLVCLLAASCGAHMRPGPTSEIHLVAERTGPLQPSAEDEMKAWAPERYLTQTAGHGVAGDLDLSAACGCADTSSSSGSGQSGPSVSPGVEHARPAVLKVNIVLPEGGK